MSTTTSTTSTISEIQSKEVTVTTTKTSKNVDNSDSKQQEAPTQSSSISQSSMLSALFSNNGDLTEKICSSFESKYDRKPTQNEINNSIQASIIQHLTNLQSEANDEANDSDYSPSNENDQNMEASDLKDLQEYEAHKNIETEDEEKSEETTTSDKPKSEENGDDANDDEQRAIVESAEFEKEFSEAIDNIKQLALADREKVFSRARESLEEETGEKVTDEELLNAFTKLRSELLEEEDDETDPILDISEEELQKEIAEAMAVVRKLGQIDGSKIADDVRETFFELNGRDPTEEELQSVFDRVQEQFAEEAEEDALEAMQEEKIRNLIATSTGQEIFVNDATPVDATTSAYGLSADASSEVAIEFLEYARDTVAEDLQRQAYIQLSKLVPDRVPSVSEINDTILSICEREFFLSSSLLDSPDANDSDYDPESDDNAQYLLEQDDIDEEELEEQFDDEEEEQDEDGDEEDDEDEIKEDKSSKLPVLTTPIKEHNKCLRVDFYFENTVSGVSPTLKSKAIERFEKTHNRKPEDKELSLILKFLSTEKTIEGQFDDMVDVE